MDAITHKIISLLPYNIQAVISNPPSLSNPQSFIPIFQLLLPYTKYILIFSSIYIIYSFLTNIFGIFSRLLRFGIKIGPIIGLIAWLMNNSGQGSLEELTNLVKQYFGLSSNNNNNNGGFGGLSPGIANLANLFNNKDKSKTTNSKYKNNKNNYRTDPISSRTRNSKKSENPGSASEIFENLVNEATKEENVNYVQDFVKTSLMKAAGVDWLFGNGNTEKKEEKKKGWTR
ncbi:uncharacterized protein I206_101697 [Kwoniella pini CBS 10737]|uniref:Uncharacterized protein n=1 Tax=Kwoniella pini CBS 10737 TaxID=1296096 RepID=A0A1B9HVZ5_9TREE|nr:uncharacterized protein I206_06334 [Kwoniella pini CBS 10737]OCF47433.1 hypothetical protein I206_06334 [Kwoniella pini CBS 10737]